MGNYSLRTHTDAARPVGRIKCEQPRFARARTRILSVAVVTTLLTLGGGHAAAQSGGTQPAGTPPAGDYNGFDLPIGAGFALPEPPPPPPPTEEDPKFYGEDIPNRSQSVIFVIDRSASMSLPVQPFTNSEGQVVSDGSRLDYVKSELKRSIMGLPSTFTFNMIIFSECVEVWRPGRMQATPDVKMAAIGWVDAIEPQGWTNTGGATSRALGDHDNMVVLLLSDGAPNFLDCAESYVADYDTHRRLIKDANVQRAVVHTFGIGLDPDTRQFMEDVARDGAGTFREIQ